MPSRRKRNRRRRRPHPHQRTCVAPLHRPTPKAPGDIYTTTPRKHGEFNATNLTSLFDDDDGGPPPPLMNNGTPDFKSASGHALLLHHSRSLRELQTHKGRSYSSMAKLRSPTGPEKASITVDVSTQTVYYNRSLGKSEITPDRSVHLEDFMDIFETPKRSQDDLLDARENTRGGTPATLNKITDLNVLAGHHGESAFNCNKKLRSSSLRRLQNFNEVLLTCCARDSFTSPKVIQNDLKNNLSEGEISFFSPQLFELEIASTPIEHVRKNEELYERAVEKPAARYFTPKIKDTNSSRCNAKTWRPRAHATGRVFKSGGASAKSFGGKSCGERPPATERLENLLKVNAYGRLVARIKRFHTKYSSRWTEKIASICSWLGLTLKKSLSSLCGRSVVTLKVKDDVPPGGGGGEIDAGCKCNEYRTRIDELNAKVEGLRREVGEGKEKIDVLVQEMGRMRQEMLQFEETLRRIDRIEEHLMTTPSIPAAPPPPPPPPPPPFPPAPPRPVIKTKTHHHQVDRCGKTSENSRPVIALEDILKVKLRKTVDKPATLTKRMTHPIISMEILSQVKLRPASSRPHTPSVAAAAAATTTSESGSPATSLTKLLSGVDTTVRRVKRLRRYSGYNLDDSRRRRERNETDDT